MEKDIGSKQTDLILIGRKPMSNIEYFQLFWTDQFLNELQKESESHFSSKFKKESGKYSTNSYWDIFLKNGVSKEAIKAYIAVLLFMGINKLPNKDLYWEKNCLFTTDFVSNVFSKNHFKMISAALRLKQFKNDEDNIKVSSDPRLKIKLFINTLCSKFQQYYELGQNITIDESVVLFKGRQKMKFYLPCKPTKWGFKLHLLCDAETHYVSNIIMDPGKTGRNFIQLEGKTLSQSIVLRLTEGLEYNGHCLYTDSWYSSIDLAYMLLEKGIYYTSILRADAKYLPTEITEDQLIVDEFIYIQKIFDKKELIFITTHPEDYPTNLDLKNEYNKNIRAIDYVNQHASFYDLSRRNNKWWKKVFYFMIEVTINNCIILKESRENAKVNTFNFRLQLMKELADTYLKREIFKNENQKPICLNTKNKLHDIEKLSNKQRQRCVHCKEKTIYRCKDCTKMLHPECHLSFHKIHIY